MLKSLHFIYSLELASGTHVSSSVEVYEEEK